jgi:hypothetical protein
MSHPPADGALEVRNLVAIKQYQQGASIITNSFMQCVQSDEVW